MAMGSQNSRLGRGLAALIGDTPQVTGQAFPAEGQQKTIAIDLIRPSPLNPRRDFEAAALEDLASSIREKGLVQPLVVRPGKGDNTGFEIVVGERRWRAAKLAGEHAVPVIIRDLTDGETLEIAVIENVQRADLNPIEEAQGYRELIDTFGYTQEDLGKIIGKSRSHLANMLRLLKLPEKVQDYLRKGKLSAGHARALVGRQDAEALAELVIAEGLNVRNVEALIQEDRTGQAKKAKGQELDPDTRAMERELANGLGLAVAIKTGAGESGEIRVRYTTHDQFEDICCRLMTVSK
jgi:ParB family chromosome partitioning protein